MKKRFLSIVLTLALVLSLMPTMTLTASAEGTYTLSGSGALDGYYMQIHDMGHDLNIDYTAETLIIDGFTSIAGNPLGIAQYKPKTIILNSSVTEIGAQAFAYFSDLTELEIKATSVTFDENAFIYVGSGSVKPKLTLPEGWTGDTPDATTGAFKGGYFKTMRQHTTHDGITFNKPLTLDDITAQGIESGNYYLESDLELTSTIFIPNDTTVNLCLNGHVLRAPSGTNAISIQCGGELNLYDCGSTEYKFRANSDGKWNLDDSGRFSLTGGCITGGDNHGISVVGGTLNLYGGNIVGNSATGNTEGCGGGVYVVSASSRQGVFNMYGGSIAGNAAYGTGGTNYAGGVYVSKATNDSTGSTFTMYGGTIRNNRSAAPGGGVYVAKNSKFVMGSATSAAEDCVIRDNKAQDGGGVFVVLGADSQMAFEMINGTISGNTATNSGGGVYAGAPFSMHDGVISDNTAGNGGGVYVSKTSLAITGGQIKNNKTAGGANIGGGVYVYADKTGNEAKIAAEDGKTVEITGNSASKGGGVALRGDKDALLLGDCTISGNTATNGGGVYVNVDNVTVGGTAKITDNFKGTGEGAVANNLYVETNKKITLGTGTGEGGNGVAVPASVMEIGITSPTVPQAGTPVIFTSNGTADDIKYFTSDNDAYDVEYNASGCLQLVIPHECVNSKQTVTGQAATCTEDGWNDHYKCTTCETLYSDEAMTNEITDLEAWKTSDGKIAMKGHAYGSTTYEWSADHTSCTATRVCANDAAHKLTETKQATYVKDEDATCVTTEKGHYTVTFDDNQFGSASISHSQEIACLSAHDIETIERFRNMLGVDGNVAKYVVKWIANDSFAEQFPLNFYYDEEIWAYAFTEDFEAENIEEVVAYTYLLYQALNYSFDYASQNSDTPVDTMRVFLDNAIAHRETMIYLIEAIYNGDLEGDIENEYQGANYYLIENYQWFTEALVEAFGEENITGFYTSLHNDFLRKSQAVKEYKDFSFDYNTILKNFDKALFSWANFGADGLDEIYAEWLYDENQDAFFESFDISDESEIDGYIKKFIVYTFNVYMTKFNSCFGAENCTYQTIVDFINEFPSVFYEMCDWFDALYYEDYANVITLGQQVYEDTVSLFDKIFGESGLNIGVPAVYNAKIATMQAYDSAEITGHNYGDPTYSWNGDTCTATRVCANDPSHTLTETKKGTYVKDTDATCTTNEKGHYEVTFDDTQFGSASTTANSYEVANSALGHTKQKINGVSATCTTDGYKDYYKCTVCNKYYSDETMETEIADLDAWKTDAGIVSKLGHKWSYTANGAVLTATCTNDAAHTATLTLNASNTTYSGTAITVSFADTTGWTALGLTLPTITYSAKEGSSLTDGKAVNAGSYTAKASVTVGANTYTATKDFAITAAPLTITGATVQGKTYDGNTNATVTGVSFKNGENVVSLTKDTDYTVTGVFDHADATGTNAATKATVTVTLSNSNYSLATNTFDVTKTIGKATPTCTAPTGLTSTVGKTLANVTLPTGFTWVEASTTSVGSVGSNTFHVKFTPTDTANYNVVESIEVTIAVSAKQSQTLTFANAAVTKTYGDAAFIATATGANTAVTYSSGNTNVATVDATTGAVTIVGAGAATITATAVENETYAEGTASYTLTVNKAKVTVPTAETNLIYNGTAQTGVVLPQDAVYTLSGNTATNAGSHDATATLTDTENYEWDLTTPTSANQTISYTIGKKAVTVTANNKSAYVGDTEPVLGEDDFTVTGLVGQDTLTTKPTLAYADTPDMTKAGTVAIKASGAVAGANYHISYVDGTLTISNRSSGGGSSSNTITVPASVEHGKLTADKTKASSGEKVTITVTPDKGYTLETLTVKDAKGNTVEVTKVNDTTYTFKMPGSKVTVEATFMEDNSMLNFFVDVKATDYYYDAVLWAAENGITSGTDAVRFSPEMGTTRAQVVTFLWRAAGCPEAEHTAAVFKDVSPDAYYVKAVEWALSKGITKGTSETAFSPDMICTRAHIAAFMARFAGVVDADCQTGFTDVSVNAYYASAVAWMLANGVTEGTTATTYSPDADCTRAQIVTFLYRWMVK